MAIARGVPFVQLCAGNVGDGHLCCALAGNEHAAGVDGKRAWLRRGFARGLVLAKLDVRGKVFVEYAPAEHCWRPVHAPGFLVVHCLWVSGRFQGQQLGRQLLERCRRDARARRGVVAVAGRKPYLTDTRFFVHHGFAVAERLASGFDLVCWPAERAGEVRFRERARRGTVEPRGVYFEHTAQCPFVPKCLRDMTAVAEELGLRTSARAAHGEGGAGRRVAVRHVRRVPRRRARHARADEPCEVPQDAARAARGARVSLAARRPRS